MRNGRNNMKLNQLEKEILKEYKCAFEKYPCPKWAFQLYPAIPVIGNKNKSMKKRVISYASAENIPYEYYNKELRNLAYEEQFCRGRYYQKNNNSYFKNVCINPFDTGN